MCFKSTQHSTNYFRWQFFGAEPAGDPYTPCGETLHLLDEIKDLDVMGSSSRSYESHIHRVVSQARQLSDMVLKTFKSKRQVFWVRQFITYIRPKLEYCCQLWHPTQRGLIRKLESAEKVRKAHLSFAQCVVRREIASVKLAVFRAETKVLRPCFRTKATHGTVQNLHVFCGNATGHQQQEPSSCHANATTCEKLSYCQEVFFSSAKIVEWCTF